MTIKKFLDGLRKSFMKFINKYILSRFVKNGKQFDVPEEQRKEIPRYRNMRKIIVVGFYVVLGILALILLISFVRATNAYTSSKQASNKVNYVEKKYEDNAKSVQYNPKLKLYTDKFIDTYMVVPKDAKELSQRQSELAKYFPSDYKQPEEKTDDTERKLNSKEFYNIKRVNGQTVIQYIVNYDVYVSKKKEVKEKKKGDKKSKTKTEEKTRKVNQKLLINIPIKSENNRYVVVEYPYFTPIPDSHLDKEKMVKDNMENEKREDNPKVKSFIKEFFDKYTSSKSEDMAYLMDNPQGLEGTREVSELREIRLYPKGDNHYIAKVEVLMKDKDASLENNEHYTLDITKKDGKKLMFFLFDFLVYTFNIQLRNTKYSFDGEVQYHDKEIKFK